MRFWRYVDRDPEQPFTCWLWTGARDKDGYGLLGVPDGTTRRNVRATHVSWMLNWHLPVKDQVLHRCDEPSCVNPMHLYLGDQLENMRDRLRKGRNPRLNQTHCKRGHLLSGPNLFLRQDTTHRNCKTSRKMKKVEREARLRAARALRPDGSELDRVTVH